MVILQNSDKDVIGLYSTVRLFLKEYNENGASEGSYDYLRKRLKDAGSESVKYNHFYLTRMDAKRGKNHFSYGIKESA